MFSWARQLTNKSCKHESQSREKEREWASLLLWDYINLGLVWTRCFFKITNKFSMLSQAFWWLHPLDNPLFPQSSLTALCGQGPLPVPLGLSLCMCLPLPAPLSLPQSCTKEGKRELLIPAEQCYDPLGCGAVASWRSKQAHAPQFIKVIIPFASFSY